MRSSASAIGWMRQRGGAGDAVAIGQASAEHPLSGLRSRSLTVVAGCSRDGSRCSPIPGSPITSSGAACCCPGTAFLELALRAGGEVGCAVVEELTQEAPLVIGESGIGAVASDRR